MSYTDITSDGGMDPRNEPQRPDKLQFKCTDCGHLQMVSVVYGPGGSRYFGSGANWCDACESGKPELVEDPQSDADRIAAHRLLHNIGLPPHPAVTLQYHQLQQAIAHLHALLNTQRTATQAWEAEKAAREWLDSIGSEAP